MPDELVAGAEHEGEAPRPEQEPAEARVGDALEQDVRRLPDAGEARFQHHEPGLHEEHEERGDEHPHRVQRVDDVVPGQLRRRLPDNGGTGLGGEVPRNSPHREKQQAEPEHLPGEVRPEEPA